MWPSLTECRKDLGDVRLRHGARACSVSDVKLVISLLVQAPKAARYLPSYLEDVKVEVAGALQLMKLDCKGAECLEDVFVIAWMVQASLTTGLTSSGSRQRHSHPNQTFTTSRYGTTTEGERSILTQSTTGVCAAQFVTPLNPLRRVNDLDSSAVNHAHPSWSPLLDD